MAPPAPVPTATVPPTNNDNVRGQSITAALNTSNVENNVIKKAKNKSLEQVQEQESNQMKALTQKMSKMEELMRGQGMGSSFDFDDMMQLDGDKLPDKFKMPQLQKFDGTGDPRIHLSQYTTTISTTKVPMFVVARFVLSLEGMAVNWYHGLEKSVRAD